MHHCNNNSSSDEEDENEGACHGSLDKGSNWKRSRRSQRAERSSPEQSNSDEAMSLDDFIKKRRISVDFKSWTKDIPPKRSRRDTGLDIGSGGGREVGIGLDTVDSGCDTSNRKNDNFRFQPPKDLTISISITSPTKNELERRTVVPSKSHHDSLHSSPNILNNAKLSVPGRSINLNGFSPATVVTKSCSIIKVNKDIPIVSDTRTAKKGVLVPKDWSRPKQDIRMESLDAYKSLSDVIVERKIEKVAKTYELPRQNSQGPPIHSPGYNSEPISPTYSTCSRSSTGGPLAKMQVPTYVQLEPQDPPLNPLTDIIHSPMSAVKLLSDLGMVITVNMAKWINLNEDDEETRDHVFRCKVFSGDVEGMCDSACKVVALEFAAMQFLKRLREEYADAIIPKWHLPEDDELKILIDDKIIADLEKLVEEKGLKMKCKLESNGGIFFNVVKLWYLFNYMILEGDEVKLIVGEGDTAKKAQKIAAIKAYSEVAEKDYPKTKYFLEEQCLAVEPKEDFLEESIVYQARPSDKQTLLEHFKDLGDKLQLDEVTKRLTRPPTPPLQIRKRKTEKDPSREFRSRIRQELKAQLIDKDCGIEDLEAILLRRLEEGIQENGVQA